MKKTWIIFLVVAIIVLAVILGVRWFLNRNENADQGEYIAERTATETEVQEPNITLDQPIETELYSFSTPIKSDSENRLTNIRITCARINNTIVKAGEEFSFCDVVGQPSSADGYKPADAFGENGEVIQAIGGGNCQVSTTIYNAALGVKGLKITERHEHDRDVAYIEDGKDATVAYDYLDLKFKNNNDYDIKMYCFVSDNRVSVKIFKV